MQPNRLSALAILVCAGLPLSAQAMTVNVNSSVPVTTQILPEMATIQGTLVEMLRMQQATGTAITRTR